MFLIWEYFNYTNQLLQITPDKQLSDQFPRTISVIPSK